MVRIAGHNRHDGGGLRRPFGHSAIFVRSPRGIRSGSRSRRDEFDWTRLCRHSKWGVSTGVFLVLAQTSLDATVPALNITSGLQWNDTLAQTEDNACSPNGNNSASGTFSISLSGSIQGGPVTVSGNLDSSSNDGIPSAFTGNTTIDIQNAITATLNVLADR